MFHANVTHYTESDDQKLGDQYTVGPPAKKLRGTCLPRSPWLLRLWKYGGAHIIFFILMYKNVPWINVTTVRSFAEAYITRLTH